MEINKDAYNAYVKEVTPVNPVWKNIVRAFVTGGIICTIGQGQNLLNVMGNLENEV